MLFRQRTHIEEATTMMLMHVQKKTNLNKLMNELHSPLLPSHQAPNRGRT